MTETLSVFAAYRCARALDELAERLEPLTDPYEEYEFPDELVAGVTVIREQIVRITSRLRDRDVKDGFALGRALAEEWTLWR